MSKVATKASFRGYSGLLLRNTSRSTSSGLSQRRQAGYELRVMDTLAMQIQVERFVVAHPATEPGGRVGHIMQSRLNRAQKVMSIMEGC